MAAQDAAYAAIVAARNADTAYMPCGESGRFAICRSANILRVQARADEPVFRFGGEEFRVIMRKRPAARSFLIPRGHEGARSGPWGRTTHVVGLGALSRHERVGGPCGRACRHGALFGQTGRPRRGSWGQV